MNADLRNLIALQDVDQKIISLKKQIAEIPNRIQSYREEIGRVTQAHQSLAAHNQELAKQRRTRESDVGLMETKLSRLKDQLMSVKTNKEYTAMLHEIEMAQEQIRIAEDSILEIMEQMETMEGKLAMSGKDYASREKELQGLIRNAEEAAPLLQAEVERLLQDKITLEEGIAAELLARYRRIADARKGIALAEAKDELCSACHVRVRPQVLADLLRTDEIHVCDSCSRILFVR